MLGALILGAVYVLIVLIAVAGSEILADLIGAAIRRKDGE